MSFVYQPTDPAFAEQAHSIYRRLRDEFPVWADPQGRFHALSRFTDVLEATKDWETFSLPRTAMRDVELHGCTIPAGARVHLLWSAANLDEREFPDPERFDIDRRPTRHLALGHCVHYCLGASLAKLEAQIAWEELLRRIPDYALLEKPEHFVSSTFYGWEHLQIGF